MNKKTTISYMCSHCNDFPVFDVSIFDFSGNRNKEYHCSCGNSSINLIKNGTKSYKAEFDCPVCNEKHSYIIPNNQFWTNDVFTFSCPFYEANLLYVGSREPLMEKVSAYIKNELGADETDGIIPDYSMIENIVKLSDMVAKHPENINICDCGDKYSVAYNENGIYIICDKCGYSLFINYDRVNLFLKETEN